MDNDFTLVKVRQLTVPLVGAGLIGREMCVLLGVEDQASNRQVFALSEETAREVNRGMESALEMIQKYRDEKPYESN